MLDVRNVEVGYGGVPALHGVSFTVNEGELVSIVGSNGSGKSTILRTISGLLRPQSGTITFQGQRIDGIRANKIVRDFKIAHVPEGRQLFPYMTVHQNLMLGAFTQKSQPLRDEMLAKVFDLFPILKERRNQLAGTLSGGQQQMLAIGRGLMTGPKLLMLDEPSLGVQPSLVDRIFETIQRIKEAGLTVLLVEQNVQESLELADKGYVIQTGRVVAEGTGAELLESDLVRRAYLGM